MVFNWTEETGKMVHLNPPEDRRFSSLRSIYFETRRSQLYLLLYSVGKSSIGGAFASVELLRVVDVKWPSLF